jgi:MOSC domain-containing protein YiiM
MESRQSGIVEGIYIAPGAEMLPHAVREANVVRGKGIEGDRYFAGDGTFYEERKTGQDLTLIEAEALEALDAEQGIELSAAEARRNVLTRGVSLNDLIGRRFRVGEVECVGSRLCEPCDHLERVTRPGVLKGLVHCGGLRTDVVVGGWIQVGDSVEELGAA